MKRKPIYILRFEGYAVTMTGSVTINVAPGATDKQRRNIIANIVRDLRSIGIEASPKQVEVKP